MENFGQRGAHARAFTGSNDDNGERRAGCSHGHSGPTTGKRNTEIAQLFAQGISINPQNIGRSELVAPTLVQDDRQQQFFDVGQDRPMQGPAAHEPHVRDHDAQGMG
jgi:hypothetical protein